MVRFAPAVSGPDTLAYPILPQITRELSRNPPCDGCIRDILHIRHHSLFTPRDFDVSPYFWIVKPSLEASFDHRLLSWAKSPSRF
ncbi:hypothetical protein SPHINGOAX6_70572 [Sphingomonas sp. AX6]|nr:hypothetical protein SPHINGOAX6_70572 [Sphingomonas sp. AX6]